MKLPSTRWESFSDWKECNKKKGNEKKLFSLYQDGTLIFFTTICKTVYCAKPHTINC